MVRTNLNDFPFVLRTLLAFCFYLSALLPKPQKPEQIQMTLVCCYYRKGHFRGLLKCQISAELLNTA